MNMNYRAVEFHFAPLFKKLVYNLDDLYRYLKQLSQGSGLMGNSSKIKSKN